MIMIVEFRGLLLVLLCVYLVVIDIGVIGDCGECMVVEGGAW